MAAGEPRQPRRASPERWVATWVRFTGKILSGEAQTAFFESESFIRGKNVSSSPCRMRPAPEQSRGQREGAEGRAWHRYCRMVVSSSSGISPTWSSRKRLRNARDSTCGQAPQRTRQRHAYRAARVVRSVACISDFGFQKVFRSEATQREPCGSSHSTSKVGITCIPRAA